MKMLFLVMYICGVRSIQAWPECMSLWRSQEDVRALWNWVYQEL